MRKYGLYFLIVAILVPAAALSAGPVLVRLHMPPPGQLNLEQLWWVDLNNTTSDTFHDVWLHGEVREARRGLVYRANTDKFDLGPGRKTVRYRDIRVKDQWHARGYEAFVLRAGRIPAGVYTYSVTLEPELGGDTGHVTVQNPTPPRLVTPRDGDTLSIGLPNMTWTRVGNYRGRVSYELVVVELRPGQTKERAVRANPPWFNRRGIPATLFRYPVGGRRLQPKKRFAWQVKVYLDGKLKPELSSEVSEFVLSPKKWPGPMLNGPIAVKREVTRYNNWFSVKLTLTNTGTAALGNIVVTDSHKYFQCMDDAWKQMEPPPGGWPSGGMMVMPGPAETSIRSASGGFYSTIEADLGGYVLAPGRSLTVQYSVLPLLTFSFGGTGHTVGTGLKLTYEMGGSQHARSYPFLAKTPVPGLADAWKAADYMILTCPSRVGGSHAAVDNLLVKMAELAKKREGALCYLTGSPTTAAIVRNITNAFGTMLRSNWQNGYLLIVGEDDVIPTWSKPAGSNPDIPAIDLSDFDYADPNDDLVPERRVGRMLGRNATELKSGIQNALDYRKEGIGWSGNKPVTIFVSGPEPGKWLFVKDMATARDTMTHIWGNNGGELHTDYITTRCRNVKHAIYALSTSGGVGWGGKADTLGVYSYKQLACWLLSLQTVPGGGTKLDQLYPPKSGDD